LEIQWLVYLLQDLIVLFEQPSLLYRHNDSTRYITTNTMFHERTKHIEIDCHIVREKLNKGLIHLLPISTTEQLADIYTKALGPQSFKNKRIFVPNWVSSIFTSQLASGFKGYVYKVSKKKLISNMWFDFVFMI